MSTEPETPRVETATPASAWSGGEAELVELPSGNAARLRRPQIFSLVQQGKIPNPLLQAAMAAADESVMGDTSAEVSPKDAVDFMSWLVSQCFVEPAMVVVGENVERGEVPEGQVPEGVLRFDRLSDRDTTYVISWWRGGVADLERFLEQQSSDADGGDGAEVRPEAVEPAGGS